MNRAEICGRLTKDIEVRKTTSGLSVTAFTVACDRRMSREDRQTAEVTADFLDCVAWRGTADFLGNYAKKGDWVVIEGRIQKRSYESNGHKHYITEIVCDNVQLISTNRKSNAQPFANAEPNFTAEVTEPEFDTGSDFVVTSSDLPW